MIILKAAWLILPAGIANVGAGLAAKFFPALNYPVDCYKCFRGKRIFGDHKTWRGLVAGSVTGLVIFAIQKELFVSYSFFYQISEFNYQEAGWIIGFLFSFGALFGDLAKSFIKRQIDIAPGKSWFIVDQTDWIAGMFLVAAPAIRFSWSIIASSFLVGLFLHLLVKFIGYRAKLDSSPV
jgi:CDP-2,3-bis-(O-geranylgeranyl)-sn-glycerol synthase